MNAPTRRMNAPTRKMNANAQGFDIIKLSVNQPNAAGGTRNNHSRNWTKCAQCENFFV